MAKAKKSGKSQTAKKAPRSKRSSSESIKKGSDPSSPDVYGGVAAESRHPNEAPATAEHDSRHEYAGRCLVPVIGSGFNHWLLDGLEPEADPILTDWWKLLRKVAAEENFLALNESLATALSSTGGDAAFGWEAILWGARSTLKYANNTLSTVETGLLYKLASLLHDAESKIAKQAVAERWNQFRKAVWENQGLVPGDLLSLNFSIPGVDISRWSKASPRRPEKKLGDDGLDKLASAPTIPADVAVSDQGLRVWFPHGTREQPGTMILGTHRYVRSAAYVERAFNWHKELEGRIGQGKQKGQRANNRHRREDIRKLTWPSVAMNAPLLLLGVGLDRTEVDFWEFLHLRARNHARLKEEERPKIWRLTCFQESKAERARWASLSAGIQIQELYLGEKWDEAWTALLGLLGDRGGIFGD